MKVNLYFLYLVIFLCLCYFISCSNYEKSHYVKESNRDYKSWLNVRRGLDGSVTSKQAYSTARKNALAHQSASRNVMDWTELGPSNWGGRTRAFLIDRFNTDHLFAGCVSGGLWESHDAGLSWYKNNAFQEVMTIASICQSINGDIYIGTGEGLYENYGDGTGGLPGNGIYKSVDGGNTFNHLPSTSAELNLIDSTWAHVNRLSADPNNDLCVFAATERGVWKTENGGDTWFLPTGIDTTHPSSDVEFAADGSYVLATIDGEIYKSDNKLDFYALQDPVLPIANVGRVEVSISSADVDYIYASYASYTGKLRGVYRSLDQGQTWTEIAPGYSNVFEPFAYYGSVYGQGDYDHTIQVSLNNPDKIFLGGIWLYSWSAYDGWNKIATTSLSDPHYYVHADMHWVENHPTDPNIIYFANDGGLFKSFDGGETFAQLSHGYATLQMYAIAASDSGDVMGGTQDNGTHYINYKRPNYTASDKLLGGDGAYTAFSSINPNVMFGSYQYASIRRSINLGASFTQFYDQNISPDGENPTGSFVTPYAFWEGVGDSLSYTSSSFELPSNPDTLLHNLIYKESTETIVNPSFLFYGLYNAVWLTHEALRFDKTPVWYKVGKINGVCESIAHSSDGDIIWAGTGGYTSNGSLHRLRGIRNANYGYTSEGIIDYVIQDTMSGDTLFYIEGDFIADSAGIENTTIISPLGSEKWSRCITTIAVNPSNPSHVIVGLGNYEGQVDFIYESTNALDSMPNFTSIEGSGLPGSPIYSVLIDQDNSNVLYAGTEFGLYRSENGFGNGGNTLWEYVGPEKVAVFDIVQKDISDNFSTIDGPSIFIGTHGRGMWSYNFDPCVDRGLCNNAKITEHKHLQNVLNVFPNPCKDELNMTFKFKNSLPATISVFDISGKLIKKEKVISNQGVNNYTLNTSDLESGIFIAVLQIGDSNFSAKFVK